MSIFDEVEEREAETGLAIDADSLLFVSCYKYRDEFDLELAYMEFCKRLGSIERACYDEVSGLTEIVICFSTRKSFRNTIYEPYKANRERNSTPESKLLGEHVRELKRLVADRLKPLVKASNVFEADDLVIQYSDKGYLTAAIDKDVVHASRNKCYNYNKHEWIDGKNEMEVNRWYILQSIMGDSSDGIKGVKGLGKVKAEKFTDELMNGQKTFDEYVELFDTPAECLLMNQLVRMNQYEGSELKLATMEDILNSIVPF